MFSTFAILYSAYLARGGGGPRWLLGGKMFQVLRGLLSPGDIYLSRRRGCFVFHGRTHKDLPKCHPEFNTERTCLSLFRSSPFIGEYMTQDGLFATPEQICHGLYKPRFLGPRAITEAVRCRLRPSPHDSLVCFDPIVRLSVNHTVCLNSARQSGPSVSLPDVF